MITKSVTVVMSDKLVGVDGRFIIIPDLDSFITQQDYHAIQWDEIFGVGWVEYTDNRPNTPIFSISFIQPALDEWERLRAIQDTPPEPNPNQEIIDAANELAAEGVTNDSITAALFLKETKGNSTILNDIETKIDDKALTLGISYEEVSNFIVKGTLE